MIRKLWRETIMEKAVKYLEYRVEGGFGKQYCSIQYCLLSQDEITYTDDLCT